MSQTATVSEKGMLPTLNGIPRVDSNRNSLRAVRDGRPGVALITEAVGLMRGDGKVSVPE